MDLTPDLGCYVQVGDRPAVRFERIYPHPIDHVWTTITDPAELAHWFPAPEVSLEPRPGGRISFRGDPHTDDVPGTVLVWEPPTRLVFSWGLELMPCTEFAGSWGGSTLRGAWRGLGTYRALVARRAPVAVQAGERARSLARHETSQTSLTWCKSGSFVR